MIYEIIYNDFDWCKKFSCPVLLLLLLYLAYNLCTWLHVWFGSVFREYYHDNYYCPVVQWAINKINHISNGKLKLNGQCYCQFCVATSCPAQLIIASVHAVSILAIAAASYNDHAQIIIIIAYHDNITLYVSLMARWI